MNATPSAVVGERIRRAREAKHMSQDDLAEALGITQQSVSKWEAGFATPGKRRMEQVAEVLSMNVVELLHVSDLHLTHPDDDHSRLAHVIETIELSGSGSSIEQLKELDPERYAELEALAEFYLDRLKLRKKGR